MKFTDEQGVAIEAIDIVPIRARAEHALSIVLPTLDQAGVVVLPVKGIVTGRWLYRGPYERPMSDVDLRATDGDLERIRIVCQQNHWPITNSSKLYRNVTFVVAGASFDVESVVGAPGMCGLRVESMAARARRTKELLGVEHWRVETHDHALLLAMNVLKDQVGRSFPWAIEDLVRVADASDFSPSVLADRAWRSGVASAVSAIARWIASARGSERWRAVAEHIGHVPRERYARAVERALRDLRAPASGVARTALARSANDLFSQRIFAFSALVTWLSWSMLRRGANEAVERPSVPEQQNTRL